MATSGGDLHVFLPGSTAPIHFIERPEDDPQVRQPDITLAKQALGWEPQVALEQGLTLTISWFASQLAAL